MDSDARFPRRFMAVLCADVHAFGRLMAADAEHCLREWRHHMTQAATLAEAHGGRLFGVAGDSFMGEFSNPVQALQFARSMQEQVSLRVARQVTDLRMEFRMGLHIGSVMVEAERLYGDAVNVAARLQELAPPGGIVVSEAFLAHVAAFDESGWRDLGVQQLKNIPFPVHAFEHGRSGEDQAAVTAQHMRAASAAFRGASVPGLSGRPALAVLPFELHTSGDGRYRYLEDALPEELIRRLAALRSFVIIDKTSSFSFRNISADSGRIGAALDARYLVYGAVISAGRRSSLTVSLVDAQARRTLWKERYDGPEDRPPEIDDDVVARIVASLGAQVDRLEQARSRRRPISSLDVDDLVQRGAWHQNKFSRSHAVEARRLLELALEHDPDHIEALIEMSWWYFWKIWTQRGDKSELAEMRRLATRAMRLDPTDARTHMLYGIAELMTGHHDHALTVLEEAIALNPSLSVAHAGLGSCHILSGAPEKAVKPLLAALRLNPQSIYLFHQFCELAVAHLMLGHWAEAQDWAERSLRLRPSYWYARIVSVAAAVRSGDVAGAKVALAALHSHCPRFAIANLYWLPFKDRQWADAVAADLRAAGFGDSDPGRESDGHSPRLK